ncbi:MAG: hypothetical protein Q9170_004704 [Blastenia crenularia]
MAVSPSSILSSRKSKWMSAITLLIFSTLLALTVRSKTDTKWRDFISSRPKSDGSSKNSGMQPPPSLPSPDNEEYIAFCLNVRDQYRDLPEFLQHHYHHHGIRRFYIMDHASKPPLSTQTYGIPSSATTFEYFYNTDIEGKGQYRTYNECNRRFGDRHTWIGYLDLDDYLQMTGHETLVEFLQSFHHNQKIGAVAVNWRTHTSSGLNRRPPEGNRKALTECIIDDPKQDNRYIKSFVKTEYYKNTISSRMFALNNDTITVGENGDKIKAPWRVPITRDRWALHHYGVKSKEQYEETGYRVKNGMEEPVDMKEWNHIEDMDHVECPELSKYDP